MRNAIGIMMKFVITAILGWILWKAHDPIPCEYNDAMVYSVPGCKR